MDNIGINVKTRQAQSAPYRKQRSNKLAPDAEIGHAVVVHHYGRRNAERTNIAKRIHLDAELAGHAERPCRTPVAGINGNSQNNVYCRPFKIAGNRFKNRKNA